MENKSQDQKTAVSYTRWSSKNQTGNSSEWRQADEADMIATEFNLTLRDNIIDAGISARLGKNLTGQFARLEKEMYSGETLILEEWSRLSRAGPDKVLIAIKPLLLRGIDIIIGGAGIGGTHLKLTKSNWEDYWTTIGEGCLRAKSENERAAKKKRSAKLLGRKLISEGQRVPYHALPPWISNPPGKPLHKFNAYILNEDKVKIVQYVFNRFLKVQNVCKLTKELNAENIVPITRTADFDTTPDEKDKRGKHWFPCTLRSLLRNRAVLGHHVCRKVETKDIYPQIIDPQVFATVNTHLTSIAKKPAFYRQKRSSLLSGLCKCASCNSNVNFNTAWNKKVYLRCAGAQLGKCNQLGMNATDIQQAIQILLERSTFLQTLNEPKGEVDTGNLDILKLKLSEQKTISKRLIDSLKLFDDVPEQLTSDIRLAQKNETRLCRQIQEEENKMLVLKPLAEVVSDYKEQLADKWNDPEQKESIQSCLRAIISHIVVDSNKRQVEVHINNRDTPIHIQFPLARTHNREIKIESVAFSLD